MARTETDMPEDDGPALGSLVKSAATSCARTKA